MESQLAMLPGDNKPSMSIVIPCFNEEGNVEPLVQKVNNVISQQGLLEFILVNNGSRDSTGELLDQLAMNSSRLLVIHLSENMGYGGGVKAGLRHASGDYVGWTHADLQTNPSDVLKAFSLVSEANAPVVIVKGYRKGRPLVDRFFSWFMGIFESLLFATRLTEINAQPTIFSRDLLKDIWAGPDDFGLDLYVLVKAKERKYRELRFPVSFGTRFSGNSKWNNNAFARLRFVARTVAYSLSLANVRRS